MNKTTTENLDAQHEKDPVPQAAGAKSDGNTGGGSAVVVNTAAPDPFDPAALKLSQNFGEALGVQKLRTTVPVRKPSKEWFVQVHPDASYRLDTMVLELKEDGEMYLVAPLLWSLLGSESTFSAKRIVTAVNTVGIVFLWPIRLPGPDGRVDEWSRSAMEAANTAMGRWTRVQANMSLGAYEVAIASTDRAPVWPTETFQQLLGIAFRNAYIDTADHPVLKRLRGEA